MNEHRISAYAVLLMMICGFLVTGTHVLAQVKCTGNQIFQTSKCSGDEVTSEENTLLDLVNKYRAANGRSELRLSASLSMVANRRMLDLKQNLRVLTHSWSNCKYDINNQKTWPCVADSPLRFKSGYAGQGYETLYRTAMGRALPIPALDAWKKSTLHNSIILNQDSFKSLEWDEVGIGIDGEFAALWFGSKGTAAIETEGRVIGLGISYDHAVKGLTKLLTIDQSSSTIENNRWQGFSPDRKLKLEIYGTKRELSEANLRISIKLEPDQTLGKKNKLAVDTLLRNIFPDWPDRDTWFDNSLAEILAGKSASKTKIVRKIAVELRADGKSSIALLIKHQEKPTYIEIF